MLQSKFIKIVFILFISLKLNYADLLDCKVEVDGYEFDLLDQEFVLNDSIIDFFALL